MAKLEINTGEISLEIERDGAYVGDFKFNPSDVKLAKRFYAAQTEFSEKNAEIEEKLKEVSSNEKDGIALYEETAQYARGVIDKIFGDGSADLVLGDSLSEQAFSDFFSGISPYFQKASANRVSKYTEKYKGQGV
jgi:hypothetical protein